MYLEESFLRGDLKHITLRASGASPQFKMNPLFEEPNDYKDTLICTKVNQRRSYSESGYASSIDSINSSTLGDRLAPPSEPEMVEKSFLSLRNLRKQSSLRIKSSDKKERLGGSLRLDKTTASAFLW